MRFIYRVAAVAMSGGLLSVAGLASPVGAKSTHPPKGNGVAFFTGGTGTAGWVSGDDPLVTGDTDGKVMQFSSPDASSYGGFVGHAIDGVPIGNVSALSYDFQVTTPNWQGGGGGSPRLVVDFSDGGSAVLTPVMSLTTGTWVHMDAMSGAVDNTGGTGCGSYQVSWSTVTSCHAGTTVTDAFLVNDSGWLAPLTVQVDNLTLNSTVYSTLATGRR